MWLIWRCGRLAWRADAAASVRHTVGLPVFSLLASSHCRPPCTFQRVRALMIPSSRCLASRARKASLRGVVACTACRAALEESLATEYLQKQSVYPPLPAAVVSQEPPGLHSSSCPRPRPAPGQPLLPPPLLLLLLPLLAVHPLQLPAAGRRREGPRSYSAKPLSPGTMQCRPCLQPPIQMSSLTTGAAERVWRYRLRYLMYSSNTSSRSSLSSASNSGSPTVSPAEPQSSSAKPAA